MEEDILIVSTISDDPFAIDVAHFFGQRAEISDLIALKEFSNGEFCPRFISDENDTDNIGYQLAGKTIVIVSTCCGIASRDSRAMRTCLVARAAKDNGAERVILMEPDLFYSAQDRGPKREHGRVDFERSLKDYKKFDGQPFSARLYAELLKTSGVDGVITVHNHSIAVERLYAEVFKGEFHNLSPASLYADFLTSENMVGFNGISEGVALCAPDAGARSFVFSVYQEIQHSSSDMLLTPSTDVLLMEKERRGERNVVVKPAEDSPLKEENIVGRDVIVFDDMIRTGYTIKECCRQLKESGARRIVFVVTHFYSSNEVKENLNNPAIDEIVTSNSLPAILNRDRQGRLRKKMLVLKIEKWLAAFLHKKLLDTSLPAGETLYSIDMSSKNPRARGRVSRR